MSAKIQLEKCAECRCTLDLFTGKHLMAKEKGRKLVCGLCSASLEIKGWREIATSE